MYILILLLVALGIVAAIIALCSKHGDDTIVEKATCSTCNGENQKCEQECMMEAATKPIEYYDDEELDRFAGRGADEYSDGEIEEFRDVLLTMRPDDIAGWARSVQLRGINLPTAVRDELIMIVAEARQARTANV